MTGDFLKVKWLRRYRRELLASLLLAIMVFQLGVRAFHVHAVCVDDFEYTANLSYNVQDYHDSSCEDEDGDCFVCQILATPYLLSHYLLSLSVAAISVPIGIVYKSYSKPDIALAMLRAPPAVF